MGNDGTYFTAFAGSDTVMVAGSFVSADFTRYEGFRSGTATGVAAHRTAFNGQYRLCSNRPIKHRLNDLTRPQSHSK